MMLLLKCKPPLVMDMTALDAAVQVLTDAEALKETYTKAHEKSKPGDKMQDGTVYVGKYSPIDRAGNSVGKTFNVFAAPENLPDVFHSEEAGFDTRSYEDSLAYIAALKGWHGHNGTSYSNDTEIYNALRDDTYLGGWIIPTADILHGKNQDGQSTTPDNIRAHKAKGAFKRTFNSAAMPSGGCFPGDYVSSTEDPADPSGVISARFPKGRIGWESKVSNRLSCRVVRLVECA